MTETGYLKMAKSDLPPELEIHDPIQDNWFNVRVFPSGEGLSIYWMDVTENKRVEIAREQHQAHVKQLVDISEKILAINTVEGLLQTLVDAARSLLGTELAVAGYGYSKKQFRLGATSSETPFSDASPIQIGQIFQLGGESPHGNLMEQNLSLRRSREELRRNPLWSGPLDGHPTVDNLAGARLVNRDGKPVGVLFVSNKKGGDFTDEDEAELVQLASLASLQLQNVEARQEAERLAEELETIFNAMSDAITVYDHTGEPVRWNPAANRLANGHNDGQRTAPAKSLRIRRSGSHTQDTTQDLVSSRALHGEEVQGERLVLTNHTGKDITVLASASPLRNATGQLTGAVTIWHDITQIEAAEEALRNSERRLRAVLDYLPVGVWLADSTGSIVYANPAGRNIWAGGEHVEMDQLEIYKGWWLDSGIADRRRRLDRRPSDPQWRNQPERNHRDRVLRQKPQDHPQLGSALFR